MKTKNPISSLKDKIPIVEPRAILIKSDSHSLLLHLDTGKVLELNDTAFKLWKLINGRSSIGEIVKRLRENYDVMPLDFEQDMGNFFQKLQGYHFIRINPSKKTLPVQRGKGRKK